MCVALQNYDATAFVDYYTQQTFPRVRCSQKFIEVRLFCLLIEVATTTITQAKLSFINRSLEYLLYYAPTKVGEFDNGYKAS